MDFEFSKDEKLLQSAVREFFEKECPPSRIREIEESEKGYDSELWRKMAQLGYLGLVFPEEYHGSEGSFLEEVIMMEEMGRVCLPSPYFSTVVQCGGIIVEAGNKEQKTKLLKEIAEGRLIIALAQYEEDGSYLPESYRMEAEKEGDKFNLSGTKMFVMDANIACKLIVAAKSIGEGLTLFLVDVENLGVTVNKMPTIGMDNTCEVVFEKVGVDEGDIIGNVGEGRETLEAISLRATIAKCAEMLGGCGKCIKLTADYAKKRIQYGKPIGWFQVIQHYMADMLLAYDTTQNYLYKTAWMADQGMDCATETSILKARVNDHYKFISERAVQIHGAIGTTREGDVGLFYRRAKSSEYMMGDTEFHYERIVKSLIEKGPIRSD